MALETDATLDQWTRSGYFKLPGYLTDDVRSGIVAESQDLAPHARPRSVSDIQIRRDGSFASPSKFAVHTGGDVLRALHRDMALLTELRNATDNPRLIPVRCSYNYYAPGDFMGVHRDEIRATVTLTFPVTESMPSTKYAAEGREWDDSDLSAFVEREGILPDAGSEMTLEPDVFNVFDGYNIPHWRPAVDEPHVLGNLIYFRL